MNYIPLESSVMCSLAWQEQINPDHNLTVLSVHFLDAISLHSCNIGCHVKLLVPRALLTFHLSTYMQLVVRWKR